MELPESDREREPNWLERNRQAARGYVPWFAMPFIAICSARVRTPFFDFLLSGLLEPLLEAEEKEVPPEDQCHGREMPKLSRPMAMLRMSEVSSALVATKIKRVGTRRSTRIGAICWNRLLDRMCIVQVRNSSERSMCVGRRGESQRVITNRVALERSRVRRAEAEFEYGYLAQW